MGLRVGQQRLYNLLTLHVRLDTAFLIILHRQPATGNSEWVRTHHGILLQLLPTKLQQLFSGQRHGDIGCGCWDVGVVDVDDVCGK